VYEKKVGVEDVEYGLNSKKKEGRLSIHSNKGKENTAENLGLTRMRNGRDVKESPNH
jgi:hypothetical protein